MQAYGQVKLLKQVLKDREPVATGPGERLPDTAARLGQCQGDCDTDDECQEHLVCRQRFGKASLPAQCVGDVASDATLDGVDFCVMPELKHLGWHNVKWNHVPYGTLSRGSVMELCEGHCKVSRETTKPDCKVGLICHQTEEGDRRVPGCWGVPVPGMGYCVHPPRTIANVNPSAGQTFGLCEGDCTSDSNCSAGLVCFERDEATLGNGDVSVPGCKGTPLTDSNYCVLP